MYGVSTKVAKQVCEKILGAKVEKTFARWLLVRSHKGRKVSGDELLTFINTFSQEDLQVLHKIYKHEISGTVPNSLMFLGATLAFPLVFVGSTLNGLKEGLNQMVLSFFFRQTYEEDVFDDDGYVLHEKGEEEAFTCGIGPVMEVVFGVIVGSVRSVVICQDAIYQNITRRKELLG